MAWRPWPVSASSTPGRLRRADHALRGAHPPGYRDGLSAAGFSAGRGSALFHEPPTVNPLLPLPPPLLLKLKPETRTTPAACLVKVLFPVSVMLVLPVPAPCRCTALSTVSPDHEQLPEFHVRPYIKEV